MTRTPVSVTNGSGYAVTHTTGDGVETTYQVRFLPTGQQERVTTFPDGTIQTTLIGINGSRAVEHPDGTQQSLVERPDPRFGMQAPVGQTMSVITPDALTATLTGARTATLTNPSDLLSLSTQTDTVTINGRTVTRAWNAATRTYTDTSPASRVTTTVLDPQGRPLQQQVGNLTATQYAYDADGRLDGIAQGSRVTTLTYDSDGNVESVTDPADRTVSFTYDAAGRVIEQVLPDARVIGFDYDAKGNLTAIAPPDRPAHGFTYLPGGQLQFYVPPELSPPLAQRRTLYSYDLSGQLTRITRPDGESIFLDYDPETAQLMAQVPSVGPNITHHYDGGTGELTQVSISTGQRLIYTSDGRLPKSEAWSVPSGVGIVGSVSRVFDNNFRVTSQSVSGGHTIGFGYDIDDLLTSAGSMNLSRSSSTGLLTGTSLSNATEAYGYNAVGEVTSYSAVVNGTPLYSVSYTRDDLGRIAAKSETVQGMTDAYGYGYDAAGRLTDVTQNSTLIGHYEYDANGNRVPDADSDTHLTFNQAGTLLGTTYDAQDRLTDLEQGPVTVEYTYTDNGELLAKTVGTDVTSYAYDLFGNLRSVTLPSTDVIDYRIDGQNRRVGKAVNGTAVQGFLYDGQLQVVAELNGSNQVVSRFVYASKANVPDYMISSGTTYRIISDHLGSVRLVANASTGAVAQRIDYDEFGNVLGDTTPGFQPFGFAGGLYDPDTGLVRFGARDYDPATGRWTAKDPIGFQGGDANIFAYVAGDPINLVDLRGTTFGTTIEAMGGAFFAGLLRRGAVGAVIGAAKPILLGQRVECVIRGATSGAILGGLVGGGAHALAAFQKFGPLVSSATQLAGGRFSFFLRGAEFAVGNPKWPNALAAFAVFAATAEPVGEDSELECQKVL